MMQIWGDADACPSEIKQPLYWMAERTKTKVTLVANQPLRTPRSEFVESVLVPPGLNVADQRIVELVEPGDLVITADIPLAADVVEQGGAEPSRRIVHGIQRGRAIGRREFDG